MSKSSIRVLHSFGSLNQGGIETWLMNILRQRREGLEFDFMLCQPGGAYEEEARAYGCGIYYRSSTSRLRKRLAIVGLAPGSHCLQRVLETNRYDVFHIHGEEFLGDAVKEAAAAGVPVRVAHCHASQLARGKKNLEMAIRWLRFRTLDRSRILNYATDILACSNAAGRFLVGGHWERDRKCKPLYCGIPTGDYSDALSRWTRQAFRKLHNIPEDAIVVGHVGNMGSSRVKNHSFLLKIFTELAKHNDRYYLFLVGDGPLREEIAAQARAEGLETRVSMPGHRADVPALLVHGFDVLVFPSTMEGLGLVIVEAAAAGLFTVCSDAIPDEVTVYLPARVQRLSLSVAPSVWAAQVEEAVRKRISVRDGIALVEKTPFSITSSLGNLIETYRRGQTVPVVATRRPTPVPPVDRDDYPSLFSRVEADLTRRPHILIVCAGLRIGGVERSLLGMLGALRPEKCEVTLFLHSHDGDFMPLIPKWVRLLPAESAYEELDRPILRVLPRNPAIALARLGAKATIGVRARWLGIRGSLLPRSVRYCLPFLPSIPGRYDLALSFLTPHDIVLRKVNAARKVGWIHTDYTSVETGVDSAFEASTWRRLDKLVAVSDEVARTFARVFPSLRDKICVVENVLSPEFVRRQAAHADVVSEMPVEDGCLRLCSVGRLSYQKAFDLAAEACRRLVDLGEQVKWFIIGYGPEEVALRQKVGTLGIEDHFTILGKRTNPYPYMAACDIYVQPSRYEGKAVTVREAQMLGRPVLITDYPTARSQVQHAVDGYVTPLGVEGIVAGVRTLAADRNLRDRLAANARSRNYGNESEAERIYALCGGES